MRAEDDLSKGWGHSDAISDEDAATRAVAAADRIATKELATEVWIDVAHAAVEQAHTEQAQPCLSDAVQEGAAAAVPTDEDAPAAPAPSKRGPTKKSTARSSSPAKGGGTSAGKASGAAKSKAAKGGSSPSKGQRPASAGAKGKRA
jgi:hypothetical protein